MTHLTVEDVQRIARGERKQREEVEPRPERTADDERRERTLLYEIASKRDDDEFWGRLGRLVSDDEYEAFWAQRPVATVPTGIVECPLCLREIDPPQNCCDACGPFIDPGLSRWE